MDVIADSRPAVIVAFIFTVIAVSVATMFLSCFGKKKDKKKGAKKGKSKSPSPQPAPRPSPGGEKDKQDKASPEIKVNDEVDDLGDFSAVQRETEILRSEINDEATLQLSYTSHQDATDKADSEPEPEPQPELRPAVSKEEIVAAPSSDKENGSRARSSMLDDIELTLANLGTDAKKEVTAAGSGVLTTIKDTEKKVVSVERDAANGLKKEKEVIEKETITKKEAAIGLSVAPVVVHTTEAVKDDVQARVIPAKESVCSGLKEIKEKVEVKTITSVTEVKEEVEKKTVTTVNTEVSKLDDIKVEIENKVSTTVSSALTETREKEDKPAEPDDDGQTKPGSLSDKALGVGEEVKAKAAALFEEVKETVQDKFESVVSDTKKEDKDDDDDPEKKKTDEKPVETKVNGTLNDLEKASSLLQDLGSSTKPLSSPKAEVKIPPKVSPKPSPKMIPRPLLTKSEAIQSPGSQDLNSPVEAKEEPVSPTTPISPTQTKAQSRIPMSKKTSSIPKFSFGASKSSSVSPLSSPDSSTAKKVDQIAANVQKEGEQVIEEVKEAADETVNNLHHNNQESHGRDSKEKSPEPDKNFERGENRGSKSRLTKLRYSGRKSADSKSDESGSERGSRAGSEAKSEDDKKSPEDASDADKSSRIPVRAGSKPRSSPPKALGD